MATQTLYLSQGQATLLRDILNEWVERTAPEDAVALFREALPAMQDEDSDEHYERCIEEWNETYEIVNSAANGLLG